MVCKKKFKGFGGLSEMQSKTFCYLQIKSETD